MHIYSALVASEVAQEILDFLPATDLVCALEAVILKQNEILKCISENKHYGTDAINDFLVELAELRKNTQYMREQR